MAPPFASICRALIPFSSPNHCPSQSTASLDGSETVLLVEDDPAVCDLSALCSTPMATRVLTPKRPQDAEELFEENHGRIAPPAFRRGHAGNQWRGTVQTPSGQESSDESCYSCRDISVTISFVREFKQTGRTVLAEAIRAADSGAKSARSSGWVQCQKLLTSLLSPGAVLAHRVFNQRIQFVALQCNFVGYVFFFVAGDRQVPRRRPVVVARHSAARAAISFATSRLEKSFGVPAVSAASVIFAVCSTVSMR